MPPLKQYKGGYFLFFLVIAVTDPICYLLYILYRISPVSFYDLSSLLLLFIILRHTKTLNRSIIIINSFIFILGVIINLHFKDIRIPMIVMGYYHVIILLNLTVYFVRKLFDRNIGYMYILAIIVYELTIIAKSMVNVFLPMSDIGLVYLLNIVDTFICLFFIFYNLRSGPRYRFDVDKLLAK